MKTNSDPRKIIRSLGKELGANDEAIKKWFQRGVAHRWRLPIVQLAQSKGIEVKPEWFDQRTAA